VLAIPLAPGVLLSALEIDHGGASRGPACSACCYRVTVQLPCKGVSYAVLEKH
jgi:hypothetical protein